MIMIIIALCITVASPLALTSSVNLDIKLSVCRLSLFLSPQWEAADAEIKVPSGEKTV